MKKLFSIRLMLLLAMAAFFYSCSKSDDAPKELLPKLDGFYIYGTNTVATSATDPEARMSLAVLDHTQGAKIDKSDGIYGKYLYIGANSKIKFANVVNQVGTVYGADNGGAMDSAKVLTTTPVKDIVIHGALKADAPEINITQEGLYYAYVDFNTSMFVIMKVRANIIGDATVKQWAGGTDLPLKSASKDSTVFEGTNILLKDASGYRYRMNDGWAIFQDPNIVTLNSLGVLSYGTAWDTNKNDIGFLNDNIPHKVTGYYTVRLKYVAATGEWSEKKIKTGELLVDYSNYKMGILGDATEGGDFNGNGNGYGLKTPQKSGDVYTWTWTNTSLIEGKEFIFLQDATWSSATTQEVLIDYALATTVSGTGITSGGVINAKAAPVNSDFANYHVIKAGAYDISLAINAKTGDKTVIINTH